MSRRSRKALARSSGGERLLLTLLGLALLAAGVIGVLVGFEVFGGPRSYRPILDPLAVDLLRAQPLLSRLVAIAAGLVLVILGMVWLARSLRPERKPDLYLDGGAGSTLRVTASAATDALAADAETLPGVARAKARLVGSTSAPALRLTLWLTDGADVGTVWRDVEQAVLSRARSSLGIGSLPTAIRLELDPSTGTTRVS